MKKKKQQRWYWRWIGLTKTEFIEGIPKVMIALGGPFTIMALIYQLRDPENVNWFWPGVGIVMFFGAPSWALLKPVLTHQKANDASNDGTSVYKTEEQR